MCYTPLHWRNLAQLNLVHLLPSVILHQQQQSLDLPLDELARETYLSINSRATLIDSVAYLLAYGKTFKNTACACYSNAAINRADTVYR